MHRESDYAGLEIVSTRKSEIKILTLTSCFCKGHLVVNWALVMQVMMCTHYREALQKCTALQQSSSSSCFTASKRVVCSPDSTQVDAGNISEPVISARCPCKHTYELQPAVFQNYPFYYFKICTSTEAKILPAVIRRIASRKERAWDLLLGWSCHT